MLLSYACINPSNLIYWQQVVVSQHFLLPWFRILASWGSPFPQFAPYFFFEFIWLLPLVLATSFQSIKKPSLCLLPIVKLLLIFILVDRASHSLRVSVSSVWKSSFLALFSSIFGILLYPCPVTLPLHPPAWITCSVSLMSVTYTGKITSLLLITTSANCIFCSHSVLFF